MSNSKTVQQKSTLPASVSDAVTLELCDVTDLAGLLSEVHQLEDVDSPTLLAGVSAIGRVIGEKAERIRVAVARD